MPVAMPACPHACLSPCLPAGPHACLSSCLPAFTHACRHACSSLTAALPANALQAGLDARLHSPPGAAARGALGAADGAGLTMAVTGSYAEAAAALGSNTDGGVVRLDALASRLVGAEAA
eukprot:158250-Chlamydomonas_euryale.AAC.1